MGDMRKALQSMGVPVDFEPDNVSSEHHEPSAPRISLRLRDQLVMDMSIARAGQLSEALELAGDRIGASAIMDCIDAANHQRTFRVHLGQA
jgi:hypothetical protein